MRIRLTGMAEFIHGVFNDKRALKGEVVWVWKNEDDIAPQGVETNMLSFVPNSIFYRDDNTNEILWVAPDDYSLI